MTSEASPGCEVARRDRLIAVSGQTDFDSFGQVPHPADAWAQVVAVVGRIRERLERVGADLSDLVKLVLFHVPGPGRGEWEMRDLLARALTRLRQLGVNSVDFHFFPRPKSLNHWSPVLGIHPNIACSADLPY